MGSEYTTREVVDLIVELGLVDPSTPDEVFESGVFAGPLSRFGPTDGEAVRSLLGRLGIRYTLGHKAFRGIADLDHVTRLAWYRHELESVAACTRGTVTVTEVQMVEEDGEWELRFDWDGVPEAWPIFPGDDDEEMEAALVFATSVHGLAGNRLGCLCAVEPTDDNHSVEAVFGDPDALNRLGARFGLTFAGDSSWLRLREAWRARPIGGPSVPG
ncbi:hypothetical protein [Nocardia testacea]|uniref:hypothetical protein n=1 Tax=Nocardia testacea TaxID=248551 RepID=UPI003A883B5F